MQCGPQWIVTDGVGTAVLRFEYIGGQLAIIGGVSVKDAFFYFTSLPIVVRRRTDHFQRYTIRHNCEKCIDIGIGVAVTVVSLNLTACMVLAAK